MVCEQGVVRLVDGYSESNGRLEMCVNEDWGTVCDEGFGSEEADSTCGVLGYKSSGRQPPVLFACGLIYIQHLRAETVSDVI